MTELKRTQTFKIRQHIKSVYLIRQAEEVDKELWSRVTIVMMVCVEVGLRCRVSWMSRLCPRLSPPAKKFLARDSMLGCWSSEWR